MKKIEWALALFVAMGFMVIQAPSLKAACAGSDVECYTVGGTQVYKLDSSGNVTNAGSTTVGGALSVTGASTVTGTQTFSGKTVHSGKIVNTPTQFGGGLTTTFGVITSSVIPYTAGHMMILSSGPMVMTALPAVSTNVTVGLSTVGGTGGAIDDGSYLILTTSNVLTNVIRLKDNATLSGSLLDLSFPATTEILTSTRPIVLQFNAGLGHWVQVSPFNGL